MNAPVECKEIDNLISLLTELDTYKTNSENTYSYSGKDYWNTDSDAEIMQKISFLCDRCLITEKGSPDYFNHAYLEKHGFKVKPGETDSCGWLSGIVVTKKALFVFG